MNIHFELALLKTLNTKNFRTLSSFTSAKVVIIFYLSYNLNFNLTLIRWERRVFMFRFILLKRFLRKLLRVAYELPLRNVGVYREFRLLRECERLPLGSLWREGLGELALRGDEGVDHVPSILTKLWRDRWVCRDVASIVVDGSIGHGVGDDDMPGLCLELYGSHEVVSP